MVLVCVVATIVLVVGGAHMAVRTEPDRYREALHPDKVVPAGTIKTASGEGLEDAQCEQATLSSGHAWQCTWVGAPQAGGQSPTFVVYMAVYPTEKQSFGSGSTTAQAMADVKSGDLKQVKKLTGLGDTGHAGWTADEPTTAQVIFAKGNALVIVTYGKEPVGSTPRPADWLRQAETAARQIATAM